MNKGNQNAQKPCSQSDDIPNEDLRVRYNDDGQTMASIAAMFGATVEQAAAILARYAVDRQKKQRRNGGK